MLMAVSDLSPVSMAILMSACRKRSMVSGTPSCSLSSIAVAPVSSREHFICLAAFSIFAWRFVRLVDAT